MHFVEEFDPDQDSATAEEKYYGYVNSQGVWDGVGILEFKTGDLFISELVDN
jgi:hypothetical protein